MKSARRRFVKVHSGWLAGDNGVGSLKGLDPITKYNLKRYGHRSFSRARPTLWNALPEDLRSTECMNKFKAHLKTFYFQIAFNV